jgi:hypothetical protein
MSTLSHLHEILEKCQSRIAAIHEIDEDIKMIAAIAERQIQLESWEVPHRPRPTTEANQDTAQAADQPVRHNLSQTPPAKQKKSQKQQHTPLTIPSKRGSTHNELRESLVISTPQGNTKPQSVPQTGRVTSGTERRETFQNIGTPHSPWWKELPRNDAAIRTRRIYTNISLRRVPRFAWIS